MPEDAPPPQPAPNRINSHCATHNRQPWDAGEKKGFKACGAFLLHDTTGNTLVERKDISLAGLGRDTTLCGSDTGGGCEAFGHPNICCPPDMICQRSSFSPSGVFCCWPSSKCVASPELPPRCGRHTSACNRSIGGGCCLHNTECAVDGCLKVYRAAPGFSLTTTTATATTLTTATTTSGGASTSKADGVTITTAKMAETAQSDHAVPGVRPGFGFSSFPLLEVVALGGAVVGALVMAVRVG
ncbi:uncharacterized protein GGS22DRAFT_188642 [Annulohypoxylon maeteangense]|uniref:uncharacterized protein n=1 Tax=Annulohypoxylon maeteangense TaxID=1927788 RepID=UPI002008EAC1|nr:uncharacterized protein GGS22DRAFT_188642 [Annulohypoxylon maeteangense]KAI0885353.1 hypothetical protein GGS22DRAFT_188642 [Annulohypoxylon maeteangense]